MSPKHAIPAFALASLLCGGTALAEDDDILGRLPEVMQSELSAGMKEDYYLDSTERLVLVFDVDKNGLDAGDMQRFRVARSAELRAEAIRMMLNDDLDGDLKATGREIFQAENAWDPIDSVGNDDRMKKLDRLDGDGDLTVTLPEAAKNASLYIIDDAFTMTTPLFALDPNKDGRVTMEEMHEIARKAFAAADKNGDGTIDAEEAKIVETFKQN